MKTRINLSRLWLDIVVLNVMGVIFIVPFVFIFLMASKNQQEASLFEFSWPSEMLFFQNLWEVIQFRDYRMLLALWNSAILTLGSAVLIVFTAAGVAFVLQRRNDRAASIASLLMLSGLVLPPAVVPTIFVLQQIGLYKTLVGLILVEVALQLPFAVLTIRAFMASIPKEIDEAAIIDGTSPWQLFSMVILPLLRPAIITVIVVTSVVIYNDFSLPLYFLPGDANVTAQLTLFSFRSQFTSSWNLLFADVVIITIPPLVMYMFFQRQIVAGLTSGAIKG
jgi:raffinose/stachyose/melibiose transport system permease protein